MRVKYLGKSYPVSLLQNNIYDVIEVEPACGWYRIIDETGEDYLFPPMLFDVIEELDSPERIK